MDERGAIGAPDLVVEILSKATAHKDLNIKLLLYQKFGVREYWIVDPDKDKLFVYMLNKKGLYDLINEYSKDDTAQVGIFSDLQIGLKSVFDIT